MFINIYTGHNRHGILTKNEFYAINPNIKLSTPSLKKSGLELDFLIVEIGDGCSNQRARIKTMILAKAGFRLPGSRCSDSGLATS